MIGRQREHGMLPADLKSTNPQEIETIGARLLRFCVDAAREARAAGSRGEAVARLRASNSYDPRLLGAINTEDTTAAARKTVVRAVPIAALEAGMQVNADICRPDGILILSSGQHLTELSIAALRSYAVRGVIGMSVDIRTLEGTSRAA
jgi:hypothetical protein